MAAGKERIHHHVLGRNGDTAINKFTFWPVKSIIKKYSIEHFTHNPIAHITFCYILYTFVVIIYKCIKKEKN